MTFFEHYFERLDGPDPYSSLELVCDDVEMAIQWAGAAARKSSQFLGGRDELRGFIDAGDTSGWAHHILFGATQGDVEFVLGATRWDESSEPMGAVLAVAGLDENCRTSRYR